MIKKCINYLSSLQFTVINLTLLFVVTVLGTLAQVKLGIYHATELYFGSFFVFFPILGVNLPLLPGGFLIGIMMLINLIFAHYKRLTFSYKKVGIWLTHIGLILLLLGSGLTHLFAVESRLKLAEGNSINYSYNIREVELVLIKQISDTEDEVISFSQDQILSKKSLTHQDLPFNLNILDSSLNSELYVDPKLSYATAGFGKDIYFIRRKKETQDDRKNITSAYVSITAGEEILDTFLVSNAFKYTQYFNFNDIQYRIEIRQKRYYTPFYMKLIDFTHQKYPGTTIPHHYESYVELYYPLDENAKFQDRIYMNHPLRYDGKTYYQASFAENDTVSILQVVHNPGWLMPYISCLIMSVGLLIHFLIMLIEYSNRIRSKG